MYGGSPAPLHPMSPEQFNDVYMLFILRLWCIGGSPAPLPPMSPEQFNDVYMLFILRL